MRNCWQMIPLSTDNKPHKYALVPGDSSDTLWKTLGESKIDKNKSANRYHIPLTTTTLFFSFTFHPYTMCWAPPFQLKRRQQWLSCIGPRIPVVEAHPTGMPSDTHDDEEPKTAKAFPNAQGNSHMHAQIQLSTQSQTYCTNTHSLQVGPLAHTAKTNVDWHRIKSTVSQLTGSSWHHISPLHQTTSLSSPK